MTARPQLLVVGVSHRTASVAVREAFAFPADALPGALAELRGRGLSEAAILSTCNRVEIYGAGPEGMADEVTAWLLARGRGTEEERTAVYARTGDDVIRHAFHVAAGLDSLVKGETQIAGQLRQAFEGAEAAGTLGPELAGLRAGALSASRRVRADTELGRHAVSVSHVAVELAKKLFQDLRQRKVVLVGAGKMGKLAAQRLAAEGADLTVMGRTLDRASALAGSLGGLALTMESMVEALSRADILLTGTGCPQTILHREQVAAAQAARGGRPLFLVDIAVPRDIDPDVRTVPGVFLYDIDDLRAVSEANTRERERQAGEAEAVVEAEIAELLARRRTAQAVPLVVQLREHADAVRRTELEKVRKRMGTLSPDQERALDLATAAIVNKLIHAPTVCLKQMAREGAPPEQLGLLRAALGLA